MIFLNCWSVLTCWFGPKNCGKKRIGSMNKSKNGINVLEKRFFCFYCFSLSPVSFCVLKKTFIWWITPDRTVNMKWWFWNNRKNGLIQSQFGRWFSWGDSIILLRSFWRKKSIFHLYSFRIFSQNAQFRSMLILFVAPLNNRHSAVFAVRMQRVNKFN